MNAIAKLTTVVPPITLATEGKSIIIATIEEENAKTVIRNAKTCLYELLCVQNLELRSQYLSDVVDFFQPSVIFFQPHPVLRCCNLLVLGLAELGQNRRFGLKQILTHSDY